MTALLAIDTATESCSVSLFYNENFYSRVELTPRQHSQKILGLIEDVLQEAEISKSSITGIAFGQGPGSFTGVRIGVSVAQGLGFGLDVPMVGVSNLEALAFPKLTDGLPILAAIDARMGEVYFGVYGSNEGALIKPLCAERVIKPSLIDVKEMHGLLGDQSVVGVGTGWQFKNDFPSELSSRLVSVEPDALPTAESILKLAMFKFQQGMTSLPEDCQPLYLRNEVAWKKVNEQ